MANKQKPSYVEWKCHTPALLKEILNNSQCAILQKPLQLMALMLAQVAERASQINDAQLNACMAKLTLYEVCDPYSKEYNKDTWEKLLNGECGVDAVKIIASAKWLNDILSAAKDGGDLWCSIRNRPGAKPIVKQLELGFKPQATKPKAT